MALLKCPECGKVVSEFARECPECGCPMSDIAQENQVADKSWDKHKEKRTTMTQAYSQEELNRALEQAKAGKMGRQERKPGQKRIIKNSESALQRKNKRPAKQSKHKANQANSVNQAANRAKQSGQPRPQAPVQRPKATQMAGQAPAKRQAQAPSPHRTTGRKPSANGAGSKMKLKIILIAIAALVLIAVAVICFSAIGQTDKKEEPTKDTMSTVYTTRQTQSATSPAYQSESAGYSEETWQGTVNHTTEKATQPAAGPTTQRQTTTKAPAPTQPPAAQPTAAPPEEPAQEE